MANLAELLLAQPIVMQNSGGAYNLVAVDATITTARIADFILGTKLVFAQTTDGLKLVLKVTA